MDAPEVGFTNVWKVGCDIERELNAANVEMDEKRKDIVYLATEKAKLEERIKRLEELGDEAMYPIEYAARVRIWTKAKENKL